MQVNERPGPLIVVGYFVHIVIFNCPSMRCTWIVFCFILCSNFSVMVCFMSMYVVMICYNFIVVYW